MAQEKTLMSFETVFHGHENCVDGSPQAVSKLVIDHGLWFEMPAPAGQRRIAPGKRSEPGVGYLIKRESRQGRKVIFSRVYCCRPSRALFLYNFLPGVRFTHPRLLTVDPPGLNVKGAAMMSFKTARPDPFAQFICATGCTEALGSGGA